MTCRRIFQSIACAFWLVLLFGGLALAQGDPALEQGLKPFGIYSGGDLDSVSLTTTKLDVHIPIWKWPQRGGKLHLNYSIRGDSPTSQRDVGASPVTKPSAGSQNYALAGHEVAVGRAARV